ncbi:MAG: hypothetical protein U0326_06660 [Polyangiales bacterium]
MLPQGTTLRFTSPRVALRRHSLAAKLTVAALATFAAGIGLGATLGALPLTVIPTVVMTFAMLIYARVVAGAKRGEAGAIEVSPAGITLERASSREVFEAKEFTAGWVVPGSAGASVEFLRANSDVLTAEVPSAEDGHAALAAAGIDARRRAVRVLFGGRWDGLGYGIATVIFVLLQGAPMFLLFSLLMRLDARSTAALGFSLLAAACMLGARILGPAEITVGADGVSWKRGFSRGFIAHRDLASVEAWHGNDVVLRKRSGELVLITHSRRDPARTAGMVEMIRGAMARAQGGPSAAFELLDRGGRSLDLWRDALKALISGRAYRDVTLTRDDLSRALDDPEATPERRVGAALALAATGEPEAIERVRVAADACASDALREALRGIARDEVDEAAIAKAARGA